MPQLKKDHCCNKSVAFTGTNHISHKNVILSNPPYVMSHISEGYTLSLQSCSAPSVAISSQG